jgi:hypothetical protein
VDLAVVAEVADFAVVEEAGAVEEAAAVVDALADLVVSAGRTRMRGMARLATRDPTAC